MSELSQVLYDRCFRSQRILWSTVGAGLAAFRNLTAFGRDMRGLASEHPGSALLVAGLDVALVFFVVFFVSMPLAKRMYPGNRWATVGYSMAVAVSILATVGIGLLLRFAWANAMVGS